MHGNDEFVGGMSQPRFVKWWGNFTNQDTPGTVQEKRATW
jgi:hypothetical protein